MTCRRHRRGDAAFVRGLRARRRRRWKERAVPERNAGAAGRAAGSFDRSAGAEPSPREPAPPQPRCRPRSRGVHGDAPCRPGRACWGSPDSGLRISGFGRTSGPSRRKPWPPDCSFKSALCCRGSPVAFRAEASTQTRYKIDTKRFSRAVREVADSAAARVAEKAGRGARAAGGDLPRALRVHQRVLACAQPDAGFRA